MMNRSFGTPHPQEIGYERFQRSGRPDYDEHFQSLIEASFGESFVTQRSPARERGTVLPRPPLPWPHRTGR